MFHTFRFGIPDASLMPVASVFPNKTARQEIAESSRRVRCVILLRLPCRPPDKVAIGPSRAYPLISADDSKGIVREVEVPSEAEVPLARRHLSADVQTRLGVS